MRTVIEKLGQVRDQISGRKRVHFLHIGKTGGTAVKHALNEFGRSSPRYVIVLHPHQTRLRDIPAGEKFFFFLRDPASRFVSGFFSRQRQGRPRYFFPWTQEEQAAFEHFATPNQLAAALSSPDADERTRAQAAMKNIEHVRDSYWTWFENEEYFRSRLPDALFVGFQESLDEDFQTLKSILSLPDRLSLPADSILAHKNPSGLDVSLDEAAIANLKSWYAEDYRFIDLCRRLIRPRQCAAGLDTR
ncbi:MAG TPA: sulfotransferase family 2 domain-containing protein [Steroidobacteraceae bacterium]|nr:sulfotransferase family 2 domain-containing protein [Steroidobacteraceae bacterium]